MENGATRLILARMLTLAPCIVLSLLTTRQAISAIAKLPGVMATNAICANQKGRTIVSEGRACRGYIGSVRPYFGTRVRDISPSEYTYDIV